MAQDFIPTADGDFDTWFARFRNKINADANNLGLVAADRNEVNSCHDEWQEVFGDHHAAQAAAAGATERKNDKRTVCERLIRRLNRKIKSSADVTSEQLEQLGLNVNDTVRTPVGVIGTRPVLEVVFDERLTHKIIFRDETKSRRAKPPGAIGIELWTYAQGNQTEPTFWDFGFLRLMTRSGGTVSYPDDHAKRTAHYMARWVNTRGEVGPWSEIVKSTIHE